MKLTHATDFYIRVTYVIKLLYLEAFYNKP